MRGNDTRRQGLHVRNHAAQRVSETDPEKIGNVLRRVVSSTRLRDVFKNREVYRTWGELVDNTAAGRTRVIGFKRKTLIVACHTHALAAELSSFQKQGLVDMLGQSLGEGVVEDIRFVVEEDVGNGKARK